MKTTDFTIRSEKTSRKARRSTANAGARWGKTARLALAASIALAGTLLLTPSQSRAAVVDTTFTLGANGLWNVGANWNNGIPNNGADTYNVFIDSNAGTNVTVTLNINPTISNLTIGLGDALSIGDTRILTIASGGGITNNGVISLNSAGNFAQLAIGGSLTLDGSGSLRLGALASNFLTGTGTLTNSASHTISGGGSVGSNNIGINNAGTIDANIVNVVMNVDPSAAENLSNSGTMRASNGGILQLTGSGNGAFNNTGTGVIQALDLSEVRLVGGASITGGTLATAGSGVIAVTGAASISALANTGNIVVRDNSLLNASGTIANSGTIRLNSAGNPAILSISDGTVFSGTGGVLLGASASNFLTGTGTLTNGASHTISGGGSVGSNSIGVNNAGTIDANILNVVMSVDPSTAGNLSNSGTMRASNGGILQFTGSNGGAFNNTATGVIRALDLSEVRLIGGASITGGTLATAGSGVIAVSGAASISDLANTGNIVVRDNSTLNASGTIANSGTISLNSAGNPTSLLISDGTVFSGAGSVLLGANAANRIVGSGTFTNAATHTISGGGSIGVNTIGINNAGLIDANLNAVAMTLDPITGLDLTNTGTLRASNGGVLVLSSNGGGGFSNTGGIIEALAGSQVQLINGASITGGTLTTGSNGVIRTTSGNTASLADLTNAGAFVLNDNSTVRTTGTINNTGSFALNSAGNPTQLTLAAATSLTGGGTVNLAGNAASRVVGDGVFRMTNVNNTIQGRGQIGANVIAVTNQGTIDANVNGATLVLDPAPEASVLDGGASFLNTGTLQASNNGVLVLSGFGGGAFTNTGGIIQALAGSEVQLINGASITGGTLTTGSNGVIRSINGNTASLADLTNAGAFVLNDNSTVRTTGTINNTGSFALNSVGNLTDLRLAAATSLTGGGTVNLTGNSASRVIGDGGFRLTNVNNTIQGRGQIGVNAIAVTNQATIDANVNGATLVLDPAPEASVLDGGASFLNTGTLQASNGGVLVLSGFGLGAFTNTGGIIQALTGSEVQLINAASITGGTLTTVGSGVIRTVFSGSASLTNLTNAGAFVVNDNSNVRITGTINNTGSISLNSSGNPTQLTLAAATSLTGGGTVNLTNSAIRITGDGVFRLTNVGNTIQGRGQIGANGIAITNQGIIDANVNGTTLVIDPAPEGSVLDGGASFLNDVTGIVRASSSSTALLTSFGGGGFTNNGTFEAVDGALTMDATALTNYDFSAGVLTGGTYRAVGGGTMTIQGNAITQIAANTTIELNAAGSVFRVAATPIETSLTTNNGTLKVLGNRNYTTANAIANGATAGDSAVLQLGGGTFNSASLTNQSGSTIFGFGNITPRPTNHGLIRSNGGTLAFGSGIQGGSGTVQIDAGSTLDLSGGGMASSADNLFHNGTAAGSLNLGANNFNVGVDYNNASFGTGNSFDKRANVTGAGQILATAPFTISTSGTVAFGNVHVGDTANLSYTVNHNGAAGASPQVRTAIQTSVNGGNITDARLSGAGVTASNLAPVVSGAVSASLGVNFTASAAGALTGQQVQIQPNFDNVTGVALSVTGAAYRFANPTAHTPEPVNFGNFHVGDTAPSQAISVTNSAIADGFSESLNAAFGAPTGGVTATGSAGLIAPGAANPANSLKVGISTAAVGNQNGTVPLLLTSDGTGTSGLGTTPLTSQTVNVTGSVYRLASASPHTPEPANLGVAHVGDTISRTITLQNTAANDGFSEKLNASFSATTVDATASGSFSQLNPQVTNNSSLNVGINTATVGNKTGTATIALVSDGAGTSGLGLTNVGTQTVNVVGQVNYFAEAKFTLALGLGTLTQNNANTFTLDYGTVNQNTGTLSSTLGVLNILQDPIFQDSLGGLFDTAAVTDFGFSGFNAFTNVAPGASITTGVSFSTAMALGLYQQGLDLYPSSSNASGTTGQAAIRLNLRGEIVPEPGSFLLLTLGGGLLLGRRRRGPAGQAAAPRW